MWAALVLDESAPRVKDRGSPALFTRGEISHIRIWSAGRGPVTLLSFRSRFHLARPRDVAREESPAYADGSVRQVH